MDGLGRAERRLADYIVANPRDAVHCTIEQLQQRAGAGYATVIRFCKRLGYSGYRDFRSALIGDITAGDTTVTRPTGVAIEPGDSTRQVADKIFGWSLALLQETDAILDTEALDRAVKAMTRARQICFTGTGTSGLSARYAFTRFFRIGMHCTAENDGTLARQKASILGPRDVLFAISSSGRSAGVVEAAGNARRAGAMVISLCDFAVSPLSRISHISLYTTPRNVGNYLNMEMPLIVGQIALIDVLFACCCTALGARRDVSAIYEVTKEAADTEKIEGRKKL